MINNLQSTRSFGGHMDIYVQASWDA